MAYTVLSNKKNTKATLHFTPANTTVIVAGNNSVSNVAITDEVLSGANINQLYWGTDAGSIQILRGANTVAVLTGTGHADYINTGIALSKDQAANVVVNFVGTANAYLIVDLQKVGTFITTY